MFGTSDHRTGRWPCSICGETGGGTGDIGIDCIVGSGEIGVIGVVISVRVCEEVCVDDGGTPDVDLAFALSSDSSNEDREEVA